MNVTRPIATLIAVMLTIGVTMSSYAASPNGASSTANSESIGDLFSNPKSADELAKTLLAGPAKELAQTQVLRGRFLHRKYLTEIPTPLEASGEFVSLREQGLFWHTQKPFESIFVLTPKAMVQQDEHGKAFKMNGDEQPAVRAAAKIFMALFAVDLKTLDNDFHLFGIAVNPGNSGNSGANSGWQLGLRPKNAAMRAVFTEAVVSGGKQVQQVELRDAHGDRTVIQLIDSQLLSRAATAQERALLTP